MKRILSITEVSRVMGISTRTIRIYEEEGFIHLERVSGRCFVSLKDIESIARIERLKRELGVNLAGAGVILEMRRKMMEMQQKIQEMEEAMDRRLQEMLEITRREVEHPLVRATDRSLAKRGERSVVHVKVEDEND